MPALPPPIWNAPAFMLPMLDAQRTNVLCQIGDSQSTDAGSNGNGPYGMHRTWKPVAVHGRGVHVHSGPPAWAGTITIDTGSGAATAPNPGAVTGAGGAGVNPIIAFKKAYSSNRPWFAPADWKCVLADITNYAKNDAGGTHPFSGVHVMARVIFLATAASLPNARFWGLRDASTQGSATVVNMTTSPNTIRWVDVPCGNGTGVPGVQFMVDPANSPSDYDETGKEIIILGVLFRTHDGSMNPLPGTAWCDCAQGSDNIDNMRARLGGTGSPTVSSAYARKWFEGMAINMLSVRAGQNGVGAHSTELDAGGYQLFKAGLRDLVQLGIDHVRSYTSLTPPVLLRNPFQGGNSGAAGYTATHRAARAWAYYEVAQEFGATFVDEDQLCANGPANQQKWFLFDGAHASGSLNSPIGGGAEYIEGNVWNGMLGATLGMQQAGGPKWRYPAG